MIPKVIRGTILSGWPLGNAQRYYVPNLKSKIDIKISLHLETSFNSLN